MGKLEEIEARRAARKAAAADAKAAQYALDMEAIDALEIEHVDDFVAAMKTPGHKPGLPVVCAVKAPSEAYYKRFCQMVRKAGNNLEARGAALDLLAESCWAYPDDAETKKALMSAFPGLLSSIGVKATELVELKAAEEGKD